MGSGSSVVVIKKASRSIMSPVGKMLSEYIMPKNLVSLFPNSRVPNMAIKQEQSSPPDRDRNCKEISDDDRKNALEIKLLSIRELVDNESTKSSIEFQALVDQHGHKIFLEIFQILEDIERIIFYRMLMIEHVPNEYHQLDEIVSLQEFLALDSASSLPIHRVCEKLQKFVRNYQTSYERWIDMLCSLQDELLIQLIFVFVDLHSKTTLSKSTVYSK